MAESIALAAEASPLASLLLSYIKGLCAFVAPRHPGASTAIIDRLSHSRPLARGYSGPPQDSQSRICLRSASLKGGEPAGGMVQVRSWLAIVIRSRDTC